MSVTIFIMHGRILRNGRYANVIHLKCVENFLR